MILLSDKELAYEIGKAIATIGGRTYFVGGYVRDALLHKENKR